MVQRVKKELNFARKVVICDSSPCQLTTVWQMHAQKLLRQHVCISRRSITESCQFHYKATTTFGCCNLHKRYHTSYFVGMLSNISDLLERKIKSYVAPRFFFFFFFFSEAQWRYGTCVFTSFFWITTKNSQAWRCSVVIHSLKHDELERYFWGRNLQISFIPLNHVKSVCCEAELRKT